MNENSRRIFTGLEKATTLIALGTLVFTGWRTLQRKRSEGRRSPPRPLPDRLQTWEDEGGRPAAEPEQTAAAGRP